ncbi:MAG: TetR/AcrR family transcriptional regulator, partial [Treponema sp.]|nr:TetR/AcrR family transcriptional regulator [Treponema sp.]
MPQKISDGSTKEKLLEAAKNEFMQNGFLKASLRTICKNAGVTTGALYFFFHDKEDLFDSIVKPVIDH